MHCNHAQHRGQYVHVLTFLSWCGILKVFDLVFLIVGSFFELVRVFLYTVVAGLLFMYLLLVGVGGDVRNNCHLAANSGTNPRVVFLGGVGPLSCHLGRCKVVFKNVFSCFFVKRCFIIYR